MSLGESPRANEEEQRQQSATAGCQRFLGEVISSYPAPYVPYPVPSSRQEEFVTEVRETIFAKMRKGKELDRNRRIVTRYYGLDGEDAVPVYKQIGELEGITGGSVKVILTEARNAVAREYGTPKREGIARFHQIPQGSFATQLYGEDIAFFKDLPPHVQLYAPDYFSIDSHLELQLPMLRAYFREMGANLIDSERRAPKSVYDLLSMNPSELDLPSGLRRSTKEGLLLLDGEYQERYAAHLAEEDQKEAAESARIPRENNLLPEIELSVDTLQSLGRWLTPQILYSRPASRTELTALLNEAGIASARDLFEMERAQLMALFRDKPRLLKEFVTRLEGKVRAQNDEIAAGEVVELFGFDGEVERRRSLRDTTRAKSDQEVAAYRETQVTELLVEFEPLFRRGLITPEQIQEYLRERGRTILNHTPGSLTGEALIRQLLFEREKRSQK